MTDGALILAFTAGLVAIVNPCGFAMLPAYLAYFLSDDEDQTVTTGMPAALRTGGLVAVGFLVVFGIVGGISTVALRAVVQALPWAAIVVGVLLVAYGIAVFAGRAPTLRLPGPTRAVEGRDAVSTMAFGGAYATASLSCTLPVFLSVIGSATATASLLGGVAIFLAYGAGMALVLLALAVAVGAGRDGVVRVLRQGSAVATRVSGAVLVLAGGYIVWFWSTSLRDPLSASGPVQLLDRWSAALTGLLGTNPLAAAGVLVAVLLVGVAYLRHRQQRSGSAG
ncbi:MAG: cytochrome c biogenesis CcdA family protein [Euzebya sp.]